MPIGHHLAKCLTCFKEFVCGDCIETECKECQCKRLGHLVAKGISICCRCGVKLPQHTWVGKKYPNTPNDPGDYVGECSRCGVEKPPSWPDIELPPCEE